jgi:hypothetical protein
MVQVLRFVRALYPVILIVAEAYRYGMTKHGDGTWKELSANEHMDKAVNHLVAWKEGAVDKPVLIDAALRILFAASVAITENLSPTKYVKDEKEQ